MEPNRVLTMVTSKLLFETLVMLIVTTTFVEMIKGTRTPVMISKDVAKYICRQRTRFAKRGVLEKPITKRYRPTSPLRCGWYLFGNCGEGGNCSFQKHENCSDHVMEKKFVQNRIHGGKDALPHSHPSMVLMIKNTGLCGAVIISEEWVLTAAHCTVREYEQDIILFAGRHNLGYDESQSEQRIDGVKKIYEHPKYKGDGTSFAPDDISLLELYKDEKFVLRYPYINYAEPASAGYKATGKATLVGWGDRTFIAKSRPLQEADTTIISDSECRRSFGYAVRDETICTYDKGISGCDGDSGGPLYQIVDGQTLVIGIETGAGGKCSFSDSPTIYSEVSHYYDWIFKHLQQKSSRASNRSLLRSSHTD